MLSTFSELRLNFMLTWSTFIATGLFAILFPPRSNVQNKGILLAVEHDQTNYQGHYSKYRRVQ